MNARGISHEYDKGTDIIVSVLCITYNQDEYLAEALEGILRQTTTFPFEVVVYDDASTDRTHKIVEDYAKRFPGIIRYIRQEVNQYSQGYRVLGQAMVHARGRYIAICEGDDVWRDTNKLQIQVSFLENNKDFVIAYHDIIPFGPKGDIEEDFGGARRDLSARELQVATPLYTVTACFRNVIEEFPPEFSSARYGDLFCWSLLGHYGRGKYLSEIVPAGYRVHQQGVFSMKSLSRKYEMKAVTDAALLSYYSRINDEFLVSHYRRQVLLSALFSLSWPDALRTVLKGVKAKVRLSRSHKKNGS